MSGSATVHQSEIMKFIESVEHLPKEVRDRMIAKMTAHCARYEKNMKTVSDVQESLDHLRLSIKYLVFDLEATRRENAYLRKMIEQGDRPPGT